MTKHTDTSRSGDLVKWLREEASFACHRAEEDMLTEAADHLKALGAENERLREVLRSLIDNYAPVSEPGYLWPEARTALGEKQ